MIIDCDGCAMRDLACEDCVVTYLLGPPSGVGSAEATALAVLAEGGLVPPLRMVSQPDPSPAGARGHASLARERPGQGRPGRGGPGQGRPPGAASA